MINSKKIINLLILFWLLFLTAFNMLSANNYGYLSAGSEYSSLNGDILPFIDIYTIYNQTDSSLRTKLNYIYDPLMNDISIYSFNNFFIYFDKYKNSKKWYYAYLGENYQSLDPISIYGNENRGLTAGMYFRQEKNLILNSIKLELYGGFTKEKIKGYEAKNYEDQALNQNGQFEQISYGGNLQFFIGNNLSFYQNYTLFSDNKSSLNNRQDFTTSPIENTIINSKITYEKKSFSTYFSAAFSEYDYDTSSSGALINGSAYYVEIGDTFFDNLRLLGKLSFIDDKYYSAGLDNLLNDLMKSSLDYDFTINNFYFFGNSYFSRNNTDFKPVSEVLTTREIYSTLNSIITINNTLNFSLRGGFLDEESLKEIAFSKNDSQTINGGLDITKILYFQSSFNYLELKIIGDYLKKNDNSRINNIKIDSQTILSYGLNTLLRLNIFENNAAITFTDTENGTIPQNTINAVENISYGIIPGAWEISASLNYIQNLLNNKKNFTSYYYSLANEFTFKQNHSIAQSVGYEDKQNYGFAASYDQITAQIQYKYIF